VQEKTTVQSWVQRPEHIADEKQVVVVDPEKVLSAAVPCGVNGEVVVDLKERLVPKQGFQHPYLDVVAPVLLELAGRARVAVLLHDVLREVVEGRPEEPVGNTVVEGLVFFLEDDDRFDDEILLGKAVQIRLQQLDVVPGFFKQKVVRDDFGNRCGW